MSYAKNRLVLEAIAHESSSGLMGIIRAICPFCVASGHSTRKKKLDYLPATGKWSCWRCKAYGWLTVAETLAPRRMAPSSASNRHVRPTTVEPPEGFFRVGAYPSPISHLVHSYAIKRGITRNAIAEAGFGMTLHRADRSQGEQDFRGRLIVPIYAPGQHGSESGWLGYVGRDVTGRSNLPYLYSKGLSRAKVLYREEILWEETEEPALCVEGTLDAAYLWPDAFAVLGTWGTDQVALMRGAKRPIVALLDGDAWRKGEALAMCLEVLGKRGGYVRLPPTKDPDQLDRAWIKEEALRSLR